MTTVISGDTGIDKVQSSVATVPTGVIIDFGGSTAPTGYLACNGAAVSRTTYAALFAAIGVLWGVGDGSTTFNVPNFPAGYAAVQGAVGASTTGQMPLHAHTCKGGSPYNATLSAGAAPISQNYDQTTSSAGSGTDNLAAGKCVLKCIKI